MGMNKDNIKMYRFNNLGGQWYLNRLNDLYDTYIEKKKKNEYIYDITSEYLELETEYKEYEKWVKKEVKRRQKIAVREYINQSIY